jgi:hypothetical protein
MESTISKVIISIIAIGIVALIGLKLMTEFETYNQSIDKSTHCTEIIRKVQYDTVTVYDVQHKVVHDTTHVTINSEPCVEEKKTIAHTIADMVIALIFFLSCIYAFCNALEGGYGGDEWFYITASIIAMLGIIISGLIFVSNGIQLYGLL